MARRPRLAPMLAAALALGAGCSADPGPSALDRAFDAYWNAADPSDRSAAARGIVAAADGVDPILERLRRGRPYAADAPTGKIVRRHVVDGEEHGYMIFVPKRYTPERRWPVRWNLHGGMGQPKYSDPDGGWAPDWAAIDDYDNSVITVVPAAWTDSRWWEHRQVLNARAILADVKRTWNVDENRVWVFGNSDGAVATWFLGMRWPDPWAYYIGFVGFPARLTNPTMRVDGQMHPANLAGQRYFLRNGVRDRIVDIEVVRGYLAAFEPIDVEIVYHEHAGVGHDLGLTDDEQVATLRAFADVRRDPLPDRLSWTTERTDRYHRRAWLVIDEIDTDRTPDAAGILPRIHGRNVPRLSPPPARPWGRVDLVREGNTVTARAVGVHRFRLLISPDEFDLDRDVRVVVNGRVAFEGRVVADGTTLLHWHARDLDRTALFVAEIPVDLLRSAD